MDTTGKMIISFIFGIHWKMKSCQRLDSHGSIISTWCQIILPRLPLVTRLVGLQSFEGDFDKFQSRRWHNIYMNKVRSLITRDVALIK